MKISKVPNVWELWYFRLAAIFLWVVVTIGVMGIAFDTHKENFIAGLSFFLLIIASQFCFYLMLKMLETFEVQEQS